MKGYWSVHYDPPLDAVYESDRSGFINYAAKVISEPVPAHVSFRISTDNVPDAATITFSDRINVGVLIAALCEARDLAWPPQQKEPS